MKKFQFEYFTPTFNDIGRGRFIDLTAVAKRAHLWCMNQFTGKTYAYNKPKFFSPGRFAFKNESDMGAFLLVWGAELERFRGPQV